MSHMISDKSVVGLTYQLRDSEGNLIEERGSNDPLFYIQGLEQIISAIEDVVEGQGEGFQASLVVSPEDGYGEYDEALVAVVEKETFPKDVNLVEGMMFDTHGPNGGLITVEVVEIEGEKITVDGNHPLAGVELHFELRVSSCRPATPEEIEHGHAHEGEHVH